MRGISTLCVGCALALSSRLFGCTGAISDPDGAGSPGLGDLGSTPLLAFSDLQAQLFSKNCAFAGCHSLPNPAASMHLDGPEACLNLVGAPSCLFPDKVRVSPGDPNASFLIDKLLGRNLDAGPSSACARSNVRMPFGGAPLTTDQIDLVAKWIAAGASCSAGSSGDGGVDAGTATSDGGVDSPGASISVASSTIVAGSETTAQLNLTSVAPPQGQMVAVQASDPSAIAVPSVLFVPGGSSVATFSVVGKRPAVASVTATTGGTSVTVDVPIVGLYLTEILFSPGGGSLDGLQWIKVYNAGSVPIDLGGYSFGAGINSYTGTVAQLSGTLPPQTCAVVGGPLSNANNGFPSYAQVYQFLPDLPVDPAGQPAFGFALFNGVSGSVDWATPPLDDVQVGTSLNPYLPGQGTPLTSPVPQGTSIARAPGGSWSANPAPAPNKCP